MYFALMNRGFLVVVQEFDWIFDGDDVVDLAVDAIQKRCQSRRLAAAGTAGHKNDAIADVGDIGDLGREFQSSKIRNNRRDHSHDDCATSPLNEQIDAKTGADTGKSVGNVALSLVREAWSTPACCPQSSRLQYDEYHPRT